eukprot:TRINITY_DN4751_c0_g1_i1.p1 TRINITY_DN4751_c0_g1~~TRINITY_DN4751_c0_g1_i1.p1  ORF type:complete len:957 (+),score=156.27 TRINITY_DN4751_c0_g1_i1:1083-3953(+)
MNSDQMARDQFYWLTTGMLRKASESPLESQTFFYIWFPSSCGPHLLSTVKYEPNKTLRATLESKCKKLRTQLEDYVVFGAGSAPLVDLDCTQDSPLLGDRTVVLSLVVKPSPLKLGEELTVAACTNDVTLVKELLAKGADPNNFSSLGETALYCASQRGHSQVVAALLSHPAINIDAVLPQGETALHAASREGGAEVIALLLVAGADALIKDAEGRLAEDLAGENKTVYQTFRSSGSDSLSKQFPLVLQLPIYDYHGFLYSGKKWQPVIIKLTGENVTLNSTKNGELLEKNMKIPETYIQSITKNKTKKLAEDQSLQSFNLCHIGERKPVHCLSLTRSEWIRFRLDLNRKKRNYADFKSESYIIADVTCGQPMTSRSNNVAIEVALESEGRRVSTDFYITTLEESCYAQWGEQNFYIPVPDKASHPEEIYLTFTCIDLHAKDYLAKLSIPLSDIPRNVQILERWFSMQALTADNNDDDEEDHNDEKTKKEDEIGYSAKLNLFFRSSERGSTQMMPSFTHIDSPRSQNPDNIPSSGFHKIEAGSIKIKCRYIPKFGNWKDSIELTIEEGNKFLEGIGDTGIEPYVLGWIGEKRNHVVKTKRVSLKSGVAIWNERNVLQFYIPEQILDDMEEKLSHSRRERLQRDSSGALKLEKDIREKEAELRRARTLTLHLYDYDAVGGDKMIAEKVFVLDELLSDWNEWIIFSYQPTRVPVMMDTKCGKEMSEQGWLPHYPVICIPGFASSALYVKKGQKGWEGKRIWLDINNLLGSKVGEFQDKLNFKKSKMRFSNAWVDHLCLMSDCITDPKGIEVRAVEDITGCMYLQPGKVGKHLAYVLGPMIKNLEAMGYVTEGENQNLYAFPYDWRIPPHYLEERDKYFSKLHDRIEEIKRRLQKPVVLVGHSMGNRIIQYFTWMMHSLYGRRWLDEHIHGWVAVGAPWLGAPKMCRALVYRRRKEPSE